MWSTLTIDACSLVRAYSHASRPTGSCVLRTLLLKYVINIPLVYVTFLHVCLWMTINY